MVQEHRGEYPSLWSAVDKSHSASHTKFLTLPMPKMATQPVVAAYFSREHLPPLMRLYVKAPTPPCRDGVQW